MNFSAYGIKFEQIIDRHAKYFQYVMANIFQNIAAWDRIKEATIKNEMKKW